MPAAESLAGTSTIAPRAVLAMWRKSGARGGTLRKFLIIFSMTPGVMERLRCMASWIAGGWTTFREKTVFLPAAGAGRWHIPANPVSWNCSTAGTLSCRVWMASGAWPLGDDRLAMGQAV